eukprot:1921451-Lingulodinium_polyedra.AAC.1
MATGKGSPPGQCRRGISGIFRCARRRAARPVQPWRCGRAFCAGQGTLPALPRCPPGWSASPRCPVAVDRMAQCRLR